MDVRAMQTLVQEAWAQVGPKNRFHIGDVAWGVQSGDDERIELWDEDGHVVAWGWLDGTHLEWQLDPRRPELLHDVLDWAQPATATSLESDTSAAEILRERGFAPDDDAPWFAYMQRDLDDVPEPSPPSGYALRTVRGPEDLAARTAVHRAAWEPSRMTEEKMRTTMSSWPYRFDLDCVAVAPDGSFASSVLAWLDEQNRVGEFEPVGTAPAHRRLGVGQAVNLFALRRLRDVGAETAIVYCRGDAAYPIPKLLYESVGFRRHDRTVRWAKG
jgi:GNAT superfamily N-acetyltransferase